MTQTWTTIVMPFAAIALATAAFAAVRVQLPAVVRTLVTVITKQVHPRV